ncbi:MAG: hypothetical protein WD096_06405 [Actinomycetota bacterium]
MPELGARTITVPPGPDWIIGAGGLVWVAGIAGGVAVFEPRTGRKAGSISLEGDLCGAPDSGFGSVWFPSCGPAGIHRVSVASRRLEATIPLALLPGGEFAIGTGVGGVWAIVEGRGGVRSLARIDPTTNRVEDVFRVPASAVSVRAGHGSLWVAAPSGDRVFRIDPMTGAIEAASETGRGPRFLVLDDDGVWVLNQGSGSVTHISPAADDIASVPVDDVEMHGGDIASGAGSIWVRGTTELVAEVDPMTHAVVARYGAPSVGSASVAVVDGQLWISSGAEGVLHRVDLTRRPRHAR